MCALRYSISTLLLTIKINYPSFVKKPKTYLTVEEAQMYLLLFQGIKYFGIVIKEPVKIIKYSPTIMHRDIKHDIIEIFKEIKLMITIDWMYNSSGFF